ncbi:MAG: hypothetical protein UR93_C0007G0021 [Berkelbacteria bacterium GW2011_GWA2_35_9]|uniref:Four helix bundle protein n=1 Tax=Berkelbacteria bacterium GW2011_GWA2_35_9 TaxID=1618333 RepID=A0A0G0D3R6_9BACT|nr:MAG: hypothetical protein UR93_C0007G0021 [Berkelbacteria bacterium GW2011_GWA2_35_9]
MSLPYENLIVYKQAVVIFDLNDYFCKTYLKDYAEKRTVEQMQQASRSGKQNIVEGISEISTDMQVRLIAVSKASYFELLEDYKDYLSRNKLKVWEKNDRRLSAIRFSADTYQAYLTSKTLPILIKKLLAQPETFCNLMITLLNQETYMLGKLVKTLESQFIKTGGYRENLTKKRLDFRRKKE